MAAIEVNKTDLIRLENLMKIIKRGKFELEGEEILGMAQVITWLSLKYTEVEKALQPPPALPPVGEVVQPPPAPMPETKLRKIKR